MPIQGRPAAFCRGLAPILPVFGVEYCTPTKLQIAESCVGSKHSLLLGHARQIHTATHSNRLQTIEIEIWLKEEGVDFAYNRFVDSKILLPALFTSEHCKSSNMVETGDLRISIVSNSASVPAVSDPIRFFFALAAASSVQSES